MKIYTKQKHWLGIWLMVILSVWSMQVTFAQNSLVGDGFGGNAGYTPTNYGVGSYAAFANCSGTLKGWGSNGTFQLSEGTDSATPVNILTDVKYFSFGYLAGAIKNDNSLWGWGLTRMTYELALTPTQFDTDAKFVNAGATHIAYTKNDGTAWLIGLDGVYQSGTLEVIPHQVAGITNCVRVACGGFSGSGFTAFLLNDGTVKIIGGSGSVFPAASPTTISSLTNVVDIKANASALYALKSDGTVWAMGENGYGELGNGNITLSSTPVKVLIPNGVSIKAISTRNDGHHATALSTTGDAYVWGGQGDENFGQLGTGNTTDISTPVLVASNVKDILTGEFFSYIVKNDNTLWATGQSTGNIWMNLSNIQRNSFTQIDPLIAPMNLCAIVATVACNAGTTAPTLSATTKSNTCPATTVDLTTITASNLPANTNLTWHSGTPATTANKVANPATITTAGTYYAAFFDATNACYSTVTTAVTATVNGCSSCNAGSSAPNLTKN